MSAVSVTGEFQGTRYGAIELKQSYHRYWYFALCLAILIHLGVVGSYVVFGSRYESKPIICVFPPPIKLGVRPLFPVPEVLPRISSGGHAVQPRMAIPIPVPDSRAVPDQTLPTSDELHRATLPTGEGEREGGGENAIAAPFEGEDDNVAPPPWRLVERDPVAVRMIQPAYPVEAIRAGIEGKVIVKMWVDKEGKVRQVEILRSAADILNEPVVEAAKQWVFTPAYMNNGPVSVWVSIPFNFVLAQVRGVRQ